MTDLLLEPREFRLLEGLRLNPRKSLSGRVRGERLTQRKGVSIEFADYRDYTEGDDLRHLDWNVLARLETPVMKTYRDEEDLAVHLLIDNSPSMDFGEPSKLEAARRFACALGYVTLNGGDTIIPRYLGARLNQKLTFRGRSSYPRLVNWSKSPTDGQEGLSQSLRAFVNTSARVGVVILISDGLDPEVATAVRLLGGRGHELLFLQILSDVEIDPDLEGDLLLLDAENGRPVEITANGMVLKEYKKNLANHNDALQEAVRRVGGRHALVRANTPLEDVIQTVFKRAGWCQ